VISGAKRIFATIDRLEGTALSLTPLSVADKVDLQVPQLNTQVLLFLHSLNPQTPVLAVLGSDSSHVVQVIPPRVSLVVDTQQYGNELSFFTADNPTTMMVRTDTPDGEKLAAQIRDAQNEKKELSLFMDPANREILAVAPGIPPDCASSTRVSTVFGASASAFVSTVDAIAANCRRIAIPYEVAASLFNTVAKLKDIPFRVLCDCCNARAHAVTKFLLDHGIVPGKVWNYAKYDNLKVDVGGVVFKWQYHVAPFVTVETKSGPQPLVFDPSLFPNPVSPEEWAKKQTSTSATREFSSYVFYARTQGGADGWLDPDFCKMALDFLYCQGECNQRS
jgi:hypothetical protein